MDQLRTQTNVVIGEKITPVECLNKWALCKTSLVTPEGRTLINNDPNLSYDTIKKLMATDWKLISDKDKALITSYSTDELVENVFLSYNEVGLAHISQCIKQNMNQPYAELVASYSDDRHLPFLQGALYIQALITQRKSLSYFCYDYHKGYSTRDWLPKKLYNPPETYIPPDKSKTKGYQYKRKLTEIPHGVERKLDPCPLCGSPAQLIRCGKDRKLWHVCCTDPTFECEMFMGLEPLKTEKQASIAWNNFVKDTLAEQVKRYPVMNIDTNIDGYVPDKSNISRQSNSEVSKDKELVDVPLSHVATIQDYISEKGKFNYSLSPCPSCGMVAKYTASGPNGKQWLATCVNTDCEIYKSSASRKHVKTKRQSKIDWENFIIGFETSGNSKFQDQKGMINNE